MPFFPQFSFSITCLFQQGKPHHTQCCILTFRLLVSFYGARLCFVVATVHSHTGGLPNLQSQNGEHHLSVRPDKGTPLYMSLTRGIYHLFLLKHIYASIILSYKRNWFPCVLSPNFRWAKSWLTSSYGKGTPTPEKHIQPVILIGLADLDEIPFEVPTHFNFKHNLLLTDYTHGSCSLTGINYKWWNMVKPFSMPPIMSN